MAIEHILHILSILDEIFLAQENTCINIIMQYRLDQIDIMEKNDHNNMIGNIIGHSPNSSSYEPISAHSGSFSGLSSVHYFTVHVRAAQHHDQIQ